MLKSYTAPVAKHHTMEYRRNADVVPHILDLDIRLETNGQL